MSSFISTPETPWIAELRARWLARPVRAGLRDASNLSGTAVTAKARAMTWKHAWSMARHYNVPGELLAYYRGCMRQESLECIALSRHYVMETERQKSA